MTISTAIKARKRSDRWDYHNNKPIIDNEPIGLVIDVEGSIPDSFIKWVPNKIFDRRKYPELYALFGKDHLPSENEMIYFRAKHQVDWFPKISKVNDSFFTIFLKIVGLIIVLTVFAKYLIDIF
jgi:hypothetical protein